MVGILILIFFLSFVEIDFPACIDFRGLGTRCSFKDGSGCLEFVRDTGTFGKVYLILLILPSSLCSCFRD